MAVSRKNKQARSKKAARSALPRARTSKSSGAPGAAASLALRILAAVRKIPRGRVSTYGNVADVAGLPKRARLVGTVLRQNPALRDLPWYRVINSSGRISFPIGSDAYVRQRKKLEAEKVVFIGGRVDLNKYGWPAREQQLDELLWKLS